MASRRLGGMGGPHRGNRPYSQHQPFQGNSVSPWQGSAPQNNSLNQTGGLLNQLAANPQQLALALSNLLQPQQQQMNNPPSLLSLNTSPAFSNQDPRDSLNRFGPRGRSDFRRNDSYKARNGGWRQLDSKGQNRRDRRRSPPNRNRQNKDRDEKRGKDDKREDKEKDKGNAEKSGEKIDTIDLSTEDNRDEEGTEETKRGWKEEKNNADDTKKSGDGEEEKDDKSKERKKDVDGLYYGVPQKFLRCFVCNKDMWNGESFQKHIRGRAHKQMLQSLEESFHITVNILRENMRLAEEKKVIELNRIHRLNKNKFNRKFQEPESHCNMCDLKFLGKIITHRKTDGHQRLKRFLHPNCEICNKEFPSRMDWLDHRLTPDHLRRLNETLQKLGSNECEIVEESLEADLEPLLEESMSMEDENAILELSDDLSNLQNRIPAYRKNRPVGTQNLQSFEGFMCDLCNKSFKGESLAQAHLRSEGHYYTFVEAAKAKFQKQTEEEAAAKEAESRKRKREEEENEAKEAEAGQGDAAQVENDDMYDPEEACNNDDPEIKTEDEIKEENNVEEEEEEEEATTENAEIKQEVKPEPVSPARITRGRGNVKNGAGPRSKKLNVAKADSNDPSQKPLVVLPNYRIPKVGGAAAKNTPGPKPKKERVQ